MPHDMISQGIDPISAVVVAGTAAKMSAETVEVARRLGVWNQIEAACRIAGELFPGSVMVDAEDDSEISEGHRIVFHVQAVGEVNDIVDRHVEWCHRIVRLPFPAPHTFFLSINVQE